MKNRAFVIAVLFCCFLLGCAEEDRQTNTGTEFETLEISMSQINDFLSLVEKTTGNPNGLIYGGGRELFKTGSVLPDGFKDKFQPFLKKTEANVAFYSFMEIEGDYGSYWAKLEVDLASRKVLKYDAMGFKIDPAKK
jgi:hypothetical protein